MVMEGRHTGGKKKDDGDKLSRESTNAVRWCVPLRSMKLFACSVFNYLHQDFDTPNSDVAALKGSGHHSVL